MMKNQVLLFSRQSLQDLRRRLQLSAIRTWSESTLPRIKIAIMTCTMRVKSIPKPDTENQVHTVVALGRLDKQSTHQLVFHRILCTEKKRKHISSVPTVLTVDNDKWYVSPCVTYDHILCDVTALLNSDWFSCQPLIGGLMKSVTSISWPLYPSLLMMANSTPKVDFKRWRRT